MRRDGTPVTLGPKARPRYTGPGSRRCELAGPPLPGPTGSPLGDALNAVAACAHAAITRFGLSRADLWPLLAGRRGPPSRARPRRLILSRKPRHRHARGPARDAHHDHHAAIPGAHGATMSTMASP